MIDPILLPVVLAVLAVIAALAGLATALVDLVRVFVEWITPRG